MRVNELGQMNALSQKHRPRFTEHLGAPAVPTPPSARASSPLSSVFSALELHINEIIQSAFFGV